MSDQAGRSNVLSELERIGLTINKTTRASRASSTR